MMTPDTPKHSTHRIFKILLALLTLLGLVVPTLFTAVQMGVFSREPELETKAVATSPDAPILWVATDYDFCPNSYINRKGELSGLYIETVTEAANRLGMRLEFKTGTWLECRAMLENKTADVLLGLEIFSNMEGTLRTIPMCSDQLCVYGKEALTGAGGLAGKRVALMSRSVIETTYDLQCEYVEYYTNTDILRAVENGDVDYGICHAAVASKIIEHNGFDLKKGVAIANSFPAMAVDASQPELYQKLNTVLQEMSLDGTVGRLKTKWLTNFTKDHSFSYVLENDRMFYITFFLSLAVGYCICIAAVIFDRQQSAYIESLLSYQQQLKESNEEAQLASKAKSQFLSHMSHDIRTPINGIMGMAERIRRNENDPALIDACLHKIDGASAHLLSLLNDVLDMSELEYGDVELEREPFDLNAELAKTKNIVEEQPNEKNTSFSVTTSIAHLHLIGSPLQLRRVLLNLIGNAQKYNKQNGQVALMVEELSSTDTQAEFVFRVRDTGIGMSREFIEKQLYKPFVQENDEVRTVYQGTGLGMSIVHNLVTRMGGTIEVESTQNVGTTFTVHLTFDIAPGPKAPEPIRQAPADLSGMRVLIAEDNELNLEIVQSILECEGVQVSTAVNGALAVEAFEKSAPGYFDAILMDIMMPVMDGLQATKAIRRLPRADAATVPILALTANAFEEDRKKVLAAGLNEHLTKPVDPARLTQALARYRK